MSATSPQATSVPRGDLEQVAVNTIRFLAADAVEKAKSGHPGLPMGMADAAFVLWTKFLRVVPSDPKWPNRDRCVLSAGHGSMLLYSLLHLGGFDVTMEDLQHFRQLGSRTPGHPEYGLTPGVETTTGPLGQGFGNAVGLAAAGKMMGALFNDASFSPIDYRVFTIAGDGDMMEGISSEAASLAGHWGLDNLIAIYDDNHVTIEGDTSLAFSEDVGRRFEAYNWRVDRANPYDRPAFAAAIERSLAERDRPSLVITRSHIGYGAPHKQDTREAHGEPLGAEELAGAKRALGWPESPPFLVPDEVRALFARRAAALEPEVQRWRAGLAAWRAADPARAARWDAMSARATPADLWAQLLDAAPRGAGATRAHGNAVLQRAAALVPSLVGGSADLEPSTKTRIKDSPSFERGEYAGRNFHFGIREHGMSAIVNGMALAGGLIPYGSSFLVFTDYARPSIRLSALMGVQAIWVFTHDSVFLGEDGPTHQPVEHLTALRAIPNLLVVRPADGIETAAAWAMALERRDAPTLIALTRQNLPAIDWPRIDPSTLARGGYLVREVAGAAAASSGAAATRGDRLPIEATTVTQGGAATPGNRSSSDGSITLIATGSEVGLALEAATLLDAGGTAVRVVSMPSPQRFLAQDPAWRDAVLPPDGRRVSIEAGSTDYWHRFVGPDGLSIGIDTFGESAPLAQLQEHFGFTPAKVAARVQQWVKRG